MATIFSRIIAGEIPCYKVAENEKFFAFLDINPLVKGHTLVVPKQEVDYIFDLSDEDLAAMHVFAKKIARAIEKAFPCKKVGEAVIGLEVPHAHIHLIPIQNESDMLFRQPPAGWAAASCSYLHPARGARCLGLLHGQRGFGIRALAGTGFQNGLQCRKQIGDDPLAVAGNRQQIGAAQHGVKIIAGAKYFRQQPLGALIRLGQQPYGIVPSWALRLYLLFQLLQLILQAAKTAVNIGVAGVKAQPSAGVRRPGNDSGVAQASINRKLFHKASFDVTEICNHNS